MRLEQPADALDDDPGLAGAGAGDDHDRPIALLDDRPLLVGERELGTGALGGSRRRYGDDVTPPGPLAVTRIHSREPILLNTMCLRIARAMGNLGARACSESSPVK